MFAYDQAHSYVQPSLLVGILNFVAFFAFRFLVGYLMCPINNWGSSLVVQLYSL